MQTCLGHQSSGRMWSPWTCRKPGMINHSSILPTWGWFTEVLSNHHVNFEAIHAVAKSFWKWTRVHTSQDWEWFWRHHNNERFVGWTLILKWLEWIPEIAIPAFDRAGYPIRTAKKKGCEASEHFRCASLWPCSPHTLQWSRKQWSKPLEFDHAAWIIVVVNDMNKQMGRILHTPVWHHSHDGRIC